MRVRSSLCLVVLSLVGTACRQPGVKATGRAHVVMDSEEDSSWVGTCEYTLSTRWATRLPHVVRMDNLSGEDAIVLSASGALRSGETRLPMEGRRRIQGLALDGSTVRGSLQGTVYVSRSGDSTVIVLRGQRTHRDTVPLTAECRIGPISR